MAIRHDKSSLIYEIITLIINYINQPPLFLVTELELTTKPHSNLMKWGLNNLKILKLY